MREAYEKEILRETIDMFTPQAQLVKSCEELAELIQEITRFIIWEGDRDHLIEKIADSEIMIDQLKMIFRIGPEEIEVKRIKTLSRLIDTVKDVRAFREENPEVEDAE